MNRILIAAAGTGGHVFPALAVAEQLRSYGWQVQWLGTDEGRLESRVVPAAGFSLHSITMQGVRGHGLLRKLLLPLTLFKAFWHCRKLLRTERIQLVLTFGGYVCAPAGLAAKWCGIPLLVHEQNAVVGLTNKLLARLANHVMLGFAAAQHQLPQAEVTGNPLRADWLQALPAPVNAVPKLLVVGGSLGAQALNQAVPQALAKVAGNTAVKKLPLQILHQCGRDRVAEVRAAYQQALHLFPPKPSQWTPEVLTCSAVKGLGIEEIWATVEKYCSLTRKNGYFEEQRRRQAVDWLHDSLREQLMRNFYQHPRVQKQLPEAESDIRNGRRAIPGIVRELMEAFSGTEETK